MKTRIILVRHAESEAKSRGIVQGIGLNIPLTLEGHAQAAKLAEALRGETIHRIYASTALRAVQTAAPVRSFHPDVPYFEIPALVERSKGSAEGMTQKEFMARHPEIIVQWNAGEDARPPGGENFEDVGRRIMPVFEAHVSEDTTGSTYLYVIHGNVNRVAIGCWLNIPFRDQARIIQDYCAINVVVYDHDKERWEIERINRTVL